MTGGHSPGAPAPLRGTEPTVTTGSDALAGQTVVLRPTGPQHVAAFIEILHHPEVARWWGGYDLERVRRELLGPHGYAVELAGEVIGLVIFYEENDPDYRHAGLDIALHPDAHGQGLGTDAMRTLIRYLFNRRGHHRIVIDPAAHNERAIRSYRRVGFEPVGVMRRYERGTDGSWHDALLMDLLREEFIG
ncbi:GNAT family N-acetyltransferase [Pseudonocardia asaccharolytica DSM 44247 = NBRC 16224]|uniref:GNAT family N-acetyltransferase n=1 Tax=Pseudonocardia asaccharolytica DSM 44247 = NBRC 16224 TaxID=1123024 RepID=A0A511CYU9_9PSEU|nr:GNAT family N-acetyltransferase [Pseudonocardia asaccharolytica DSM 44247 = NBRC 16224]